MTYKAIRIENKGVCYIDNPPPNENHKLKENWFEFSGDEQWEVDTELQQKEAIKTELTAVYEAQDEFLQAQFEPARNAFLKHFESGDIDKAIAILQSPYIPAEVKPIVQAIYDKYIELTGS